MQVSPRFAVLFMMLLAGSVGAGDVPSTDSPTQAPAGVQLPMNTAPFEGKSCTPVKVEGDATYCIEGRVCSSGSFPGSYCPKSGDVALSNCWTSHPSYNLASNNCVAYADAECKPINGSEILGCVFPSIAAAPAPAQTVNKSPLDVGANALTNAASAPSTAQTSMMATTFSASNDSNNGNSHGNSGKGLGAFASAAIAVAVVVVAVAAVAVMKGRRDERQHQDTSSRALSCVELSTPV
uniref:Carbohydrate-binding module family 19 domain-containing protein n=1 Tax=Globisporangium ultimum (strain ATCC 200006 / CBS 805.95 / DAOM BR144) TaxID=431595 RepID=K3X4H5_GLOUD